MSRRYPSHEEYVSSGVATCPARPVHWGSTRLKFLSVLNSSKSEVSHLPDDTEVTFLPMEAVGENGELDVSRSRRLGELRSGYTYLREGDVCIAKITPCFENGKGAVIRGTTGGVAFGTTELIPFRCARPGDAEFLYYLLKSPPFAVDAEASMYGAGGQKRVSDSFAANYSVVLPPESERSQIAKFLDYETAKIDRLIDKQQQLIALLKEKRQAVISHAVTKGLNPDAPMKDSGVQWLGEVPAHWGVARLKFLVSQVVDCHHSTPSYDPEAPWPALRTSDIHPGRLAVANAQRVHTDEYNHRISRLKPQAGDVIYAREGGRWGVAAPVPPGVDVCLAQRVMLLRGNQRMASELVMWNLNSSPVYNQLAVDVAGSASPHVNIGDVLEVWMAVPPEYEQEGLLAELEAILDRMTTLDQQADQMIGVLQERRTALISAAVTGKIDVRGWKPPEDDDETRLSGGQEEVA